MEIQPPHFSTALKAENMFYWGEMHKDGGPTQTQHSFTTEASPPEPPGVSFPSVTIFMDSPRKTTSCSLCQTGGPSAPPKSTEKALEKAHPVALLLSLCLISCSTHPQVFHLKFYSGWQVSSAGRYKTRSQTSQTSGSATFQWKHFVPSEVLHSNAWGPW